jgi:hypothetical protein
MEIEISQPTKISWLQFPNRQIVALRSAFARPDRSRTQWARSAAENPLPIPMLDWPSSLFRDEVLDH